MLRRLFWIPLVVACGSGRPPAPASTDDSHLLAIGIDLPPDATNWRDRSLQLSIFDVSDLILPRRTVQYRIGSAWAWSEALRDHHAFNWFPEKRLSDAGIRVASLGSLDLPLATAKFPRH